MKTQPFVTNREIHVRIAKASERHLPEDERRQAVRITATGKPSMPGLKGGQGRSGAELEQSADALLLVLGLAAAAILGVGGAELIAHAADAFGAAYLAN